MNQPLFVDRLVVHGASGNGRTGEYDLFAEPAGPAGECVLPLAGTVLRFDAAVPGRLCGIEVPGDINREFLGRLIGVKRAELVLSRRPSRTARARVLDALGQVRTSLQTTSQPRTTLSWAASLWSLARDLSLPDVARASGALELTFLAGELDQLGLPGVASLRTDQVVLAASLLRRAEDEVLSLAESDPQAAAQLADLCRAVGVSDRTFTETAQLVERAMTERTDDRWHPFGEQLVVASASFETRFAHAARHPNEPMAYELHAVQPEVELRSGGRLVLHPRAEQVISTTCWVRVLRTGSLELLSLVPLLKSGRNWRAEALIPPRLTVDDLDIEIIEAERLLTPSRLEQVRSAIALGREAVSITRTGALAAAFDVWMECSAMWESLGDRRRAELARDATTSRSQRANGSLADRIAFGAGTTQPDFRRRR